MNANEELTLMIFCLFGIFGKSRRYYCAVGLRILSVCILQGTKYGRGIVLET